MGDRAASYIKTSSAALVVQLALQIAIGVALSFRYVPTLEGGHGSVASVRSDAFLGYLQNFHYWGSSLLIAHSFVHLAAMVWTGSYRPPNAAAFLSALIIFLTAFLFQVTGNVLPMDRHDVQTAVIEAGIAGGMPAVGPQVADLILQGKEFGQDTLDVWYLVHRYVLTGLAVLGALLAWVSSKRNRVGSVNVPALLLPVAALLVLAFAFQAPAGEGAVAVDYSEQSARVSWYTWPMHGALMAFQRLSPELGWIGAGLLPGLFVGFLALLPLLGSRVPVNAARAVFFIFTAGFLGMAIGFGGSFAPLIGNQDPPATSQISRDEAKATVVDKELAKRGRELFNELTCQGCHGKDGKGGQFGPNLEKVHLKHQDADWYKRFIKNPQSIKPSSTMTPFPDLPDDQLSALAEYLRSPR